MATEFRTKKQTTTEPGRDVKSLLLLVVLALAGLAGLFFLIFRVMVSLGETGSALAAAGLALALLPAFWVGYFFGKTEVRGFLRGADMIADRFADKITQAVTTREQSTIRVHNATKPQTAPPVQVAVALPGLTGIQRPQITDRTGETNESNVLDL